MTKHFADTEQARGFKHPDKDKLIVYILLMYGKDSSLNSIIDVEERRQAGMKIAELQNIPDTEEFRRLVVYYLNYFQYHHQYTLFRTREEVLMEALSIMREPLDGKDPEERMKNVKLKGDLDVLCERLIAGIEKDRQLIYGQYKETAAEVIRESLTPEQRLKAKKK